MYITILNYICSGIILFSCIVFTDLLLTIKNSGKIKFLLCLLTIGIGLEAAVQLYFNLVGFNRLIMSYPAIISFIAIISLFSYIYHYKTKTYIYLLVISIIAAQAIVSVYFLYIHPIDVHVDLDMLKPYGLYKKGVRFFFQIIMVFVMLNFYKKINVKYDAENIYFKKLRKWSLYLVALITFLLVNNIARNLFGYYLPVFLYIKTIAGILILCCLQYRPKFLNRATFKENLWSAFNNIKEQDINHQIFSDSFFINLYYLNKDAGLDSFASSLGTDAATLSNFIYSNYGVNFTDLVNKNRIAYFVDLIMDGKQSDYTIDALGQLAGFGSRQNLYKAFKKFHGGAPTDLIKATNL